MRLFEITDPDPEHAKLATEVADVYRRLYTKAFDALEKYPPSGAEVRRDRHAVIFRFDRTPEEFPGDDHSPHFRTVADVLHRLGWSTDLESYKKNIAYRNEEYVVPDTPRVRRTGGTPGAKITRQKKMSISRVLDQALRDENLRKAAGLQRIEIENAKKAFENDPVRRGAASERRGERYVVVVSFDPLEAAHMSAKRGWSSCWMIGGAREGDFRNAMECGIATAWLTTEDDIHGDRWLDDPTARWLVVPYVDPRRRDLVTLRPIFDRYHVYGSPPAGTMEMVAIAVDRIEESLNRAFGIGVGEIGVTDVDGGLPDTAVRFGAGDPRRFVHALLAGGDVGRSIEAYRAGLGRLGPSGMADAARSLAREGILKRTAADFADALERRGLPRSPEAADAMLYLVANGILPRDYAPPPETFGTKLCTVLWRLERTGSPPPERTMEAIWEGEDLTTARLLGLFGRCVRIRKNTLPDREEALRILDRIERHGDSGDRNLGELAWLLRERGRSTDPQWTFARGLGWRILFKGRRPEEIETYEAFEAPGELREMMGENLPLRLEIAARLGEILRERMQPGKVARELRELMDSFGREAVLRVLREAARESGKMRRPPPWGRTAAGLVDAMKRIPRGEIGRNWNDVRIAMGADLIDVADVLRAAGEADLKRLPYEIEDDSYRRSAAFASLPLPLRIATLLVEKIALPVAYAALAGETPMEILDALREITRTGRAEVADRARTLLAWIEGRGDLPRDGRLENAAILLVLLDVVDPEELDGRLGREQWHNLALSVARLPPEAVGRAVRVLALSEAEPSALPLLDERTLEELARHMVRHGTPVPWDEIARIGRRGRNAGRRISAFVRAYRAAGGRVPRNEAG